MNSTCSCQRMIPKKAIIHEIKNTFMLTKNIDTSAYSGYRKVLEYMERYEKLKLFIYSKRNKNKSK